MCGDVEWTIFYVLREIMVKKCENEVYGKGMAGRRGSIRCLMV